MKKRFGAIALAMILFMSFCVIPTLASAGTRVISQDPPGQELIRWRTILITNQITNNSSQIMSSQNSGRYKNTTKSPKNITRKFSSGADTQWKMGIGTNAQRSDLVGFPGNYGSTVGTSKTINVHLNPGQTANFYTYRTKATWKWEHVLQDQYYDDETGTWKNCSSPVSRTYSVVERVYTDFGYSVSN